MKFLLVSGILRRRWQTLIHICCTARGTSEPGTYGLIVGDGVIKRVTSALPSAKGHAIDYPASTQIVESGAKGEVQVVARLTSQSQRCPKQTFALVGYSQGAGVMHGAFKPKNNLTANILPKIKALVMFGDGGFKATKVGSKLTIPPFPASLQPRVLNLCNPGDPVRF
jgi:cutinase